MRPHLHLDVNAVLKPWKDGLGVQRGRVPGSRSYTQNRGLACSLLQPPAALTLPSLRRLVRSLVRLLSTRGDLAAPFPRTRYALLVHLPLHFPCTYQMRTLHLCALASHAPKFAEI